VIKQEEEHVEVGGAGVGMDQSGDVASSVATPSASSTSQQSDMEETSAGSFFR
jgi:hypothetical protein